MDETFISTGPKVGRKVLGRPYPLNKEDKDKKGRKDGRREERRTESRERGSKNKSKK